ncbi:response regulator transcription factor [Candidatus Peregrinibacteria bacterium]|nr:MAG: response regulator transcription factor [Candidatus Peregrinibacteria bacterium]
MKILLVEDEQDIARFLIRGLELENYLVTHVTNGKGALYLLGQQSFDLAIIDLMLPIVDGEELISLMRRKGYAIPVLVLTALHQIDVKVRLLNNGADDFLTKPFSFVELVARIQNLTKRNIGSPADYLVVKDLVMHPKKYVVKKGAKTVKLRMREFALLEYMMRHKNQLITRNTLIEQVWDYNAHIFSNTVDSHMSQLRKKIGDCPKDPIIETIHGMGYILRDA